MTRPALTPSRPAALTGVAVLTLLLAACGAPTPSTPAVTPAPAASPPVAGTPAPAPASEPLRSLGTMQVTFDGIGTAEQRARAVTLGTQGLSDVAGGLQMQAVSSGSFTTGTRGVDGVRYLYATFRVRNASTGGTPYATPARNLTLLAASTPTTIDETAIGSMTRYDGTPAAPGIARTLLPTPALTYSAALNRAVVVPGGEDLQVYPENDLAALGTPAGVTRVFPYGFVVRRAGSTSSRALPASPAAGVYDGSVTLAMRLPLQATAAEDPFALTYTFEVVDDPVTRVTESVEEQGTTSAQTRAANLAPAEVVTLCGSTYPGSDAAFVGSATTAGNAQGSRLAHIGGDLARLDAVPAVPVTGNTSVSVPAASGLLSHYRTYPPTPGGAAPTATVTGAAATLPGASLTAGTDGALTYLPPAGTTGSDTVTYTVTAGGCTAPAQKVTLPITNRVWYVDSSGSGANDGRSTSPFASLAGLNGKLGAGDFIRVRRGNGLYTGSGLTLPTGVSLTGEGVDLTVGGRTLEPRNALGGPTLNLTGAGVTLGTNNAVRGLSVTGSTSGLTGTGFGTLALQDVTLGSAAGPALDLTTGTVTSSGSVVLNSSGSATHGVNLAAVTGTLNVTGGTLQTALSSVAGTPNHGVNVTVPQGTLTLGLTGVTLAGNDDNGLNVTTTGTGGVTLNVTGSTLRDNLGDAALLRFGGSAASRFVLDGNTVTNTAPAAQNGGFNLLDTSPAGTVNEGRISANTLTLSSSATAAGDGVRVGVTGAGRTVLNLSGNTVSSHGTYGVILAARTGSGRLDVTATGNTVRAGATLGLEGVSLQAGDATAGESATLCLNLTGNAALPGASATDGYVLRQRAGTTLLLQGFTSGQSPAAWLSSKSNTGTLRVRTPTPTPQGGTCTTTAQ